MKSVTPILWEEGRLMLLDQTKLPGTVEWLEMMTEEDVADAITTMVVRGAPAIGVAAAFGLVLACHRGPDEPELYQENFSSACRLLASTRPTAVNLFWAIDRMSQLAQGLGRLSHENRCHTLLQEALAIQAEDLESCMTIGRNGAEFLAGAKGVMTHCNAGALATAGYGTALGVIRAAWDKSPEFKVYARETRPLLQGARLTAWELMHDGIDTTLVTDSMAAHMMARGMIQAVVVGADRIAANGDSANKIGTYGLAISARYHNIPFYIAAPWSTVDMSIPEGGRIVIEERSAEEVTTLGGVRTAPEGVGVYNPAFDVTPAELITGIITDRGVATGDLGKMLASMATLTTR